MMKNVIYLNEEWWKNWERQRVKKNIQRRKEELKYSQSRAHSPKWVQSLIAIRRDLGFQRPVGHHIHMCTCMYKTARTHQKYKKNKIERVLQLFSFFIYLYKFIFYFYFNPCLSWTHWILVYGCPCHLVYTNPCPPTVPALLRHMNINKYTQVNPRVSSATLVSSVCTRCIDLFLPFFYSECIHVELFN